MHVLQVIAAFCHKLQLITRQQLFRETLFPVIGRSPGTFPVQFAITALRQFGPMTCPNLDASYQPCWEFKEL